MAKKYIRRTHKKHRKTAHKRTVRKGGACPCTMKLF